jgi:hypothetical protein
VTGIINDALWFNKSGDTFIPQHFIKETLVWDETSSSLHSPMPWPRFRVPRLYGRSQIKANSELQGSKRSPYRSNLRHNQLTVERSSTSPAPYYDYYTSGENVSGCRRDAKRNTTDVRRTVTITRQQQRPKIFMGRWAICARSRCSRNASSSSWNNSQHPAATMSGDATVSSTENTFWVGSIRLGATGRPNPLTATDVQLATYDNYFEYDSQKRVTLEKTNGARFTYGYAYANSAFSDGYNNWKTKTTETLPDGNQNIVYTNFAGQVMLKVFRVSDTVKWYEYYKYDSKGQVIQKADSNAVASYSEGTAGLVTLNASTGLVRAMFKTI